MAVDMLHVREDKEAAMICEECAWEADMRKFHGNSVRILKGQGHAVCLGGTHCDCHHSIEVATLPKVEEYAESLQALAGEEWE